MDYLKMVAMCETIAKDESKEQVNLVKRGRGPYEPKEERLHRDVYSGEIRQFGPHDTEWYRRYVSDPSLLNNKFHRKFRRRFLCSY